MEACCKNCCKIDYYKYVRYQEHDEYYCWDNRNYFKIDYVCERYQMNLETSNKLLALLED
jgi:hypothetical protein